jgi:hypothetical protein
MAEDSKEPFRWRSADTPEFDIDFINEPDPHMPDLSAHGIGEIGNRGRARRDRERGF